MSMADAAEREAVEAVARGIVAKLLRGKLRIDGLLPNVLTLNTVTRIFSVQ